METLIFGITSPVTINRADMVSEEDMTAMIFSSVVPMLLMSFLFAGCISIAPESIAGEKERGTLGAMLVTPVKRSHIALGKIISLSAIALISGVCSFAGLVLSLPKLVSGSGMALSASTYGFSDYVMMLGIVLSSVLVMVSAVSVVSALAKSVKEATGFVGPLSLIPMLLGLSTMFTSGIGGLGLYVIPLYNSARALHGIFSFMASPLRVVITVVSNALWAVAISVLLSKMFDSEKVMFNS
jgi:sodium transport system permease protein